jgi:hypothetical protein
VLVILGIERVDMADAAAHEEKNDGPGLRGVMRADYRILYLAGFRPDSAEREPQEPATDLVDEIAAREAAAGIDG